MKTSLTDLPIELHLLIVSYLDLSSLNIFLLTNQYFYDIANENHFWEAKLRRHFPAHYHLKKSYTDNFKHSFIQIEKYAYRGLSKEKITILRLLKERDFSDQTLNNVGFDNQNEFFKATIGLKNYIAGLHRSPYLFDMNDLVIHTGNKELLDYYYHHYRTKYDNWLTSHPSNPLPTKLRHACLYNQIENFKELVESADMALLNNSSLLHLTAKYGHIDILRCLLEKGVNVDATATSLVDDDFYSGRDTALYIAVKNRHVDVVSLLLDYGADVSKLWGESLKYAAMHGQLDLVVLLIETKKMITPDIIIPEAPLEHALMQQHFEVVNYLLQAGVNLNATKKIFLRKIDRYLSPVGGLNNLLAQEGLLARFFSGCWGHHYIKEAKALKRMLDNPNSSFMCIKEKCDQFIKDNKHNTGEFNKIMTYMVHTLNKIKLPEQPEEETCLNTKSNI